MLFVRLFFDDTFFLQFQRSVRPFASAYPYHSSIFQIMGGIFSSLIDHKDTRALLPMYLWRHLLIFVFPIA